LVTAALVVRAEFQKLAIGHERLFGGVGRFHAGHDVFIGNDVIFGSDGKDILVGDDAWISGPGVAPVVGGDALTDQAREYLVFLQNLERLIVNGSSAAAALRTALFRGFNDDAAGFLDLHELSLGIDFIDAREIHTGAGPDLVIPDDAAIEGWLPLGWNRVSAASKPVDPMTQGISIAIQGADTLELDADDVVLTS